MRAASHFAKPELCREGQKYRRGSISPSDRCQSCLRCYCESSGCLWAALGLVPWVCVSGTLLTHDSPKRILQNFFAISRAFSGIFVVISVTEGSSFNTVSKYFVVFATSSDSSILVPSLEITRIVRLIAAKRVCLEWTGFEFVRIDLDYWNLYWNEPERWCSLPTTTKIIRGMHPSHPARKQSFIFHLCCSRWDNCLAIGFVDNE